MKRITAMLALTGALSLTLTGCGDPCADLRPNAQDRVVFENGGEVEREGKRDVECEASRETDGKFVQD